MATGGPRILICGGRTFEDAGKLNRAMAEIVERYGEPSCVIEGGARGADYLGKLWAEHRGIPVFECRANWNRYGKRAGFVRNGWMLEHGKPDLVVAFPGGNGTRNMIEQAAAAGTVVCTPLAAECDAIPAKANPATKCSETEGDGQPGTAAAGFCNAITQESGRLSQRPLGTGL